LLTISFVVLSAFLAALLRGFTGFGFRNCRGAGAQSRVLPPTRVLCRWRWCCRCWRVSVDLRARHRGSPIGARWCGCRPGLVVGTPLGLWLLTRLSADEARLTIGLLILGSVVCSAVVCDCPRVPRSGCLVWSA
jgi:hypothetical protein